MYRQKSAIFTRFRSRRNEYHSYRKSEDGTQKIAYFIHRSICGAANIQLGKMAVPGKPNTAGNVPFEKRCVRLCPSSSGLLGAEKQHCNGAAYACGPLILSCPRADGLFRASLISARARVVGVWGTPTPTPPRYIRLPSDQTRLH